MRSIKNVFIFFLPNLVWARDKGHRFPVRATNLICETSHVVILRLKFFESIYVES